MNDHIVNLLLPTLFLITGAALLLIAAGIPSLAPYRGKTKWAAAAVIAISFLSLVLQGNTIKSWQAAAPTVQSVAIKLPALALRLNTPGRYLGLVLIVITLGAVLVSRSRKEDENNTVQEPAWPLVLFSLAAALLTFLPANLLTLAVVWTVFDVITAAIWMGVTGNARDALLHWSTGAASILLVWCAVLALQAHGTLPDLPLTELPAGWMGTALFLAVALRLGPFPFHLGRPVINTDKQVFPICRTCLQVIPPASGVWLLTQIQVWSAIPTFSRLFFSALLMTGLLACGLLAWLPREYPRVSRWIVAGQAALVLLAAMWAETGTALAEGVVLLLAGGLLIHYTGQEIHTPENRAAAAIGIAALAGLPLTWGGDGRLALMDAWISQGWGYYVLIASGTYMLLLGAAIKLVIHAQPMELDLRDRILVGAGFGLPALGLFIRSGPLVPDHAVIWLAILLPAAGGAVLAWWAHSLQPLQQEIEPWLHNALSLDWLRSLAGRIGQIAGQVTHGIHQVLESEGALLWVLATLILGWMLMKIR